MDVIALHQAGFDNAVASLGTSLTTGHAGLLKRYAQNVYLTYDSDGAGMKAALRAIPILREAGIAVKVINLKPYKDPDEFIKALGADAYQERIDQAENGFMFEIRMAQQQYDMHDPEGKTAFYKDAARRLCVFTEKLERDNYIDAVASQYGIAAADLQRLVHQYGADSGRVGTLAARPPVKPKNSGYDRKKEDGMKQSQKLLLTWLASDTGLFPIIRKYISPEDFTGELYYRAAQMLFAQFDETGTVNPAKIISMFPDGEEQKEIAGIFHATIQGDWAEEDKKASFEKALKETVIRVKTNSMEHRLKTMVPTDMEALQRSVADKRALEELKRVHISID